MAIGKPLKNKKHVGMKEWLRPSPAPRFESSQQAGTEQIRRAGCFSTINNCPSATILGQSVR